MASLKVKDIYSIVQGERVDIPLVVASISAGFPSPAEDHIEKKIDLNELLIKHPAATFFVRVEGESMSDAGITSGDTLIVDKALQPKNDSIIVAVIDGEFTVKRIQIRGKQIFLKPENHRYKPIEITEEMDFTVWGVVTYVIHAT